MKIIDAHTHVHFAAYTKDWKEVIDRALGANIGMILVGTQYDTSARGIEVAKLYDGVYATVGLHPIHTERSYHDEKELGIENIPRESALSPRTSAPAGFTSRGEQFDVAAYKKLAENKKVVGIGECGLDFYRVSQSANRESQIAKQKKTFELQIQLAHEVKKPLMIHCRDGSTSLTTSAFSDLIAILRKNRALLLENPGVIHFFTGTVEDARQLLELGFSFTFGGVITFTRDYDEAINIIPLDRILCETDAPYVAPLPYRGKRNEPAFIVETVKKLAELKGISFEAMAAHTFENTKRIFKM